MAVPHDQHDLDELVGLIRREDKKKTGGKQRELLWYDIKADEKRNWIRKIEGSIMLRTSEEARYERKHPKTWFRRYYAAVEAKRIYDETGYPNEKDRSDHMQRNARAFLEAYPLFDPSVASSDIAHSTWLKMWNERYQNVLKAKRIYDECDDASHEDAYRFLLDSVRVFVEAYPLRGDKTWLEMWNGHWQDERWHSADHSKNKAFEQLLELAVGDSGGNDWWALLRQ